MNSEKSEGRRKRAGIIQSNYIPWKGYFDFIDSVDVFVLLDDVQYTRRDWRNRNRIKTKDGLKWLTVPVEVKGKYFQSIGETRIASDWVDEHLAVLRHAYAQAPFFKTEWPAVEALFQTCRAETLLTNVNENLIRGLCARLGITTPVYRSTQFDLSEGKNERLMHLCKQLGAGEYLSGPAAREYLDEEQWHSQGVRVFFKSYAGYLEYDQVHPPFENGVSVLDTLFHTGPDVRRYIKSEKETL